MTPPIRRVVLDVLKPYEPDILEFTAAVADCESVDGVNAVLVETDREVQTLKLTIEGDDVDTDAVEGTVETVGGSVHSIDQVVCGDRLVEQSGTPQDR
ncbi:hypothetical protein CHINAEXTREME_18450 [Halobiforma lacisalsi AJ5]|uniref:DUF211 domain-containing protein n=1 Tax=Natronobacterium lacisalsi AJ5 TaxID=358396 RepID=M0LU13_NATLA|nr:DUF211 domain-containing protein [Halobiforma lacisalsi]APW99629.1 hypothetical protein CHINAEXTREME_18450 [Halobiforma lacisalsi AJ5]EMA35585.1 hypothetical protein C445_05113 [Halobiforma lacisalsi AJ5]